MATAIDTYIDALSMDMEEFSLLDKTDREQLYEDAIKNLSADEITALQSALNDVMSKMSDDFSTKANRNERNRPSDLWAW